MCLTASLDSPQLILSECLRCLTVYAEDHLGCLEGMLHNGLRNKIIHFIQSELASSSLPTVEIMRQSLHLLCVLCGYSHSFETSDQAAMTAASVTSSGNSGSLSASSIPVVIGINEQMLYEILLIVQSALSRDLCTDELVVINIAILCQYLLPLCRSSDPMYQVT
jgi:hypothetical protein